MQKQYEWETIQFIPGQGCVQATGIISSCLYTSLFGHKTAVMLQQKMSLLEISTAAKSYLNTV